MDNNQKNLSDAAAMAQFRFALIAPVIHGLYPDASRNAYYQRVTANPLTLPDGSVCQYSPKTISKWGPSTRTTASTPSCPGALRQRSHPGAAGYCH